MKTRAFFGQCACAAPVLLIILSGAGGALGQKDSGMGLWITQPSDLSLAVEEVPTADSALTSTEQGHTELDQSFDFREWRLEKRQRALEDTTFELNLRSFYFDRSDFASDEHQAWA